MAGKRSRFYQFLLCASSAALISPAVAHAQDSETAPPARPLSPVGTVTQGSESAPPSQQQAATATTSSSENQIGDIVVYGSKRNVGELAQSVPASITAISRDLLESRHTLDVADLQRYVPNATLRSGTFPGYPNYEIRGIQGVGTLRSQDPAISSVQDDMVVAYPAGALLSTFDLESVEVLRGPQGVLFGRNASGGAVIARTRLPGSALRFIGEASFGNYNEIQLRGSIEGEITPGIRAKVAVMQRWNSGYYRNTLGGTFVPAPNNPSGQPVTHRTGAVNTNEFIIKPTIVFDLGPDVTFTLFTQYARIRDPGGYVYAIAPPPGGTPTALSTAFGFTPPTERYTWNVQEPGYTHLNAGHAIGQLRWNVGPGALTAVAAYREVQYNSTQNSDGSPFSFTIFPDNREHNHQESLEVRYAGDLSDRFHFVLGGFLLRSSTDVLEKRRLSSAVLGLPFGTFRTQQVVWDQTTKSEAVFGAVDWEVVPSLTLSAGGRFTWENKALNIIPLALCAGPADFQGCPTTYISRSMSWSDFSPRAVASWRIDPHHTLYASYSKGFRSGNFNARATTVNALGPSNPESNASYEIGSKNTFLDGRLRLNLTGFYQDFRNIERTAVTVVNNQQVQTLVNAATATVQGLEGELSWILFPGFRIDGNVGYTDAHYDSFTNVLPGLPAGTDPTTLLFDRLSKWRYMVGFQYDWHLLNGAWSANATYSWRSSAFTDVNNTPASRVPSVGIVDANLSYQRGNVRYSLYGRNLTNELNPSNITRGINYFAIGGGSVPRTYGVQISVDF